MSVAGERSHMVSRSVRRDPSARRERRDVPAAREAQERRPARRLRRRRQRAQAAGASASVDRRTGPAVTEPPAFQMRPASIQCELLGTLERPAAANKVPRSHAASSGAALGAHASPTLRGPRVEHVLKPLSYEGMTDRTVLELESCHATIFFPSYPAFLFHDGRRRV